jgi:hypothetical protein
MKAIEITDVRKRYRNLQALKGSVSASSAASFSACSAPTAPARPR